MVRRLLYGLVLGLIVGVLLASALVGGLKVLAFDGAGGTALAYASAALAGVLTGLVAGKPIWASGAGIEAALKAVFGALLGAGAMFALRKWAGVVTVDLSFMHAGGPATLGDMPAASLPIIASTLGALFELDNTGDQSDDKVAAKKKRVSVPRTTGSAKARVADGAEELSPGPDEVVAKRAKP